MASEVMDKSQQEPSPLYFHIMSFLHKTHSQMLGKFEYTGGPIFKVVLEC